MRKQIDCAVWRLKRMRGVESVFKEEPSIFVTNILYGR